jgi:Mlc titration factor MtfA (ptsG expression regulator)
VPLTLEQHEPNLYEVMRDFYKQDPAARIRRQDRSS